MKTMRNLILSMILVLGFMVLTNDAVNAATKVKTPKPVVTGTVANLADILAGNSVALAPADAEKLVEKGQSLVLVSGTGKKAKVYFVMNADGSIAAKRIAKMADKNLEIFGTLSVRSGLNVVIADKFQEKAAPAPKK